MFYCLLKWIIIILILSLAITNYSNLIKVVERNISDWKKAGECLQNETSTGCGTQTGYQKEIRTCVNGTIEFCDKIKLEREVECDITIECPSTLKPGIVTLIQIIAII